MWREVGVIDQLTAVSYRRNAGLLLDADLALALECGARRFALVLEMQSFTHLRLKLECDLD